MKHKWHCYVINLERSKERVAMQAEILQDHQVSWTRIAAIDGQSLLPQLEGLDQRAYDFRHGKAVNPNELGCYLSHIKAMEEFLRSDHDYAVILEDDCRLDEDFIPTLEALFDCNPLWDAVKLSGRHNGMPVRQKQLTATRGLVARAFRHTGAEAYVVNRKAAQIYCNRLLPMKVPYDHEFDRAWVYGLKFRGVEPNLVKGQAFGGTTIGYDWQKTTKKRKKPMWKRGSVLLYRGWNEMARIVYFITHGLFIPRR